MRVFCISLCFLALLPSSLLVGQSANERTESFGDGLLLQRVLQRYTNAYGGLRDANILNSILITGTQSTGGKEYDFQLRKTRPAFLRFSLRRGAQLAEVGYNGKTGWLRTIEDDVSRVEALSGEALLMLKGEADFDGPLFRHLENPQNSISVDSMQRVGDEEAYVVRVVSPDLPVRLFYLQKQNSLLLQVETLSDSGGLVLQTRYRDYRYIGGFPFAFEVENLVNGKTVSLTRIEDVEVDPGLFSFMFEMPKN